MRKIDLRIVLVRSLYERNVGAASRAMANMGFTKLILIGPQCKFTLEAQKAAATGQAALENKVIYKDWDDFFAGEPKGLFIATTARDGRGRQAQDLETALRNFKDTHIGLNQDSDDAFPIHLVFGPEDWGLSGDDIQYANACCTIPTYGDNTSLNLAQASLLAMFIFRSVFGGERTRLDGQQKAKENQKKPENIFPDQSLKAWLTEMGFQLDKKKMNVFTVLRRMLLQNAPSTKEFKVLEIVLQQTTRKLKELKVLQIQTETKTPPIAKT